MASEIIAATWEERPTQGSGYYWTKGTGKRQPDGSIYSIHHEGELNIIEVDDGSYHYGDHLYDLQDLYGYVLFQKVAPPI